ncbi:hypothetical protein [Priestia sp. YIM B13486]|uniref:hypothetical protein n=1 Tax=Priestia sp. YIM B13486 TaxID=3366304 RepID=UPI00366C51C2
MIFSENNFTGQCTIKGVEYIKIRYDSNVIIDNTGKDYDFGASRKRLFSVTDMDFLDL